MIECFFSDDFSVYCLCYVVLTRNVYVFFLTSQLQLTLVIYPVIYGVVYPCSIAVSGSLNRW